MTKLQKKTTQNPTMPAGLFGEGVEAFWHAGEKWILMDGQRIRFNDAPLKVRNMIANVFLHDEPSKAYFRKIGVTGFSSAFEMWYRCVIGALDATPDFINDEFTPDTYNTSCSDFDCPHRGKLCGRKTAINNQDVQTLMALSMGETFRETASYLYISEAGLKSRVTKLRQKIEAKNIAALTARAAEIGIHPRSPRQN